MKSGWCITFSQLRCTHVQIEPMSLTVDQMLPSCPLNSCGNGKDFVFMQGKLKVWKIMSMQEAGAILGLAGSSCSNAAEGRGHKEGGLASQGDTSSSAGEGDLGTRDRLLYFHSLAFSVKDQNIILA